MAKLLDGMERMLRGEMAPPPAATLIGVRLESFAQGECDVVSDGKLVAHAVSTCMTLRGEQAAGR